MKRYYYIFIALLALVPFGTARAQDSLQAGLENTGKEAGYNTATSMNVATVTGQAIKGIMGILGVVFMLLLFYGGVLWMTSAGSEERITKAKKIMSSAAIGLAITIASYFIAKFIFDIIIGAGPSTPVTP